MKKPICFGNIDAMEIPCSPKELGGTDYNCIFKKECIKKTFGEPTTLTDLTIKISQVLEEVCYILEKIEKRIEIIEKKLRR